MPLRLWLAARLLRCALLLRSPFPCGDLRLVPAVVVAVLAAGALAGCDRPFVKEAQPEIAVVSPDLSVATGADGLALVLRAGTFRPIARVEVNGVAFVRGADSLWRGSVALASGLNRLALRAVDAGGVARQTDAYALRLAPALQAFSLPFARSGHAAVRLADGRVLVCGGVDQTLRPARDDAFLIDLSSGVPVATALSGRMQQRRTGHTATLLPDGRVLILGGSAIDGSRTLTDLVQTAEVFDPARGTFSFLLVRGAGVRNAYHQTLLRMGPDGLPYVAVVAGEGAPSGSSTTRYAERDDARFYRVDAGELVATTGVTSGYGNNIGQQLSGFSATPLTAGVEAGGDGRVAVFGAERLTSGSSVASRPVGLAFAFAATRLTLDEAATPLRARHRHAAARLADSLVLVLGGAADAFSGTVPAPSQFASGAEVYASSADRHFTLPQFSFLRYGHTATALGDGRVLVVGGLDASGNTVQAALLVTTPLR